MEAPVNVSAVKMIPKADHFAAERVHFGIAVLVLIDGTPPQFGGNQHPAPKIDKITNEEKRFVQPPFFLLVENIIGDGILIEPTSR